MIRTGFVSNSSSTSFIVILGRPIPTTFDEFKLQITLLDSQFDDIWAKSTQYPYTYRQLYRKLMTDAQRQPVNDFVKIRRLFQWDRDGLPSAVCTGELSWHLGCEHRTQFDHDVRALNAKYTELVIQRLWEWVRDGLSYTYVFEYGNHTGPLEEIMEQSDIWDFLLGTVIPISHR